MGSLLAGVAGDPIATVLDPEKLLSDQSAPHRSCWPTWRASAT